MNNDQETCDPQRIELCLQQKLSDEEQAAFELHLDACDGCRRRLEATAAGDDIWSGVRDSLFGQQADCPPSNVPELDPGLDSTIACDATFSHDTVLKLLAPTDDDRMLGRLGTYEVVGVVGSGGMGVVLKAFDAALNRYVAIKVLAPHLGSSGAARKRFSREAQAAAAVVHDNVMEIHGVADADGLPYLVMPYVRGPSLQRRLDDDGPLALVEILRIGVQAALGLAAAHAQGLVHRDIKPANILLENGVERVKLTDFGLARAADDVSLTRTGVIAGTPQYMSPEQARGESVDQRSDLFSLGSVLYAMCTGRAPFRAETSYGVLRCITDEEPRSIREINPDIPEWLCQIIGKLMSKQPDDRHASAVEVAELLGECLAHVQQPTVVRLPDALTTRSCESRFFFALPRSIKGGIAMIGVFGASLLGMVLWQASAPPDIAGKWTGEEWNTVVLEAQQPGWYNGTYTDSENGIAGTVRLKWSRFERRFNGTWQQSEDRFGELSLRLVGKEIRGARTIDPSSEVDATTPRLSDFLWARTVATPKSETATPRHAAFGPVEERIVNDDKSGSDWMIDLDSGKVYTPPPELDPEQNPGADTQKLMAWVRQQGIDATGIKAQGGELQFIEPVLAIVDQSSWESVTPQQVRDTLAEVVDPSDKAVVGGDLYAFRTREGGIGVLQVVARGSDSPSVRIRYKLLRTAEDAATDFLTAPGDPRHELLGKWYGQFVDGSYLPSDAWCVWEFREDGKNVYTRGRYGPDGKVDLAQGDSMVTDYKIDEQGRLVLFMPGEKTKYCPLEIRDGTVYISVDHENDFVFTREQRPSQYIQPRKTSRIDRAAKRYESTFRILAIRWLERNMGADGRQPVNLADLAGDEPERTLSPLGPARIVPESYADWDRAKRQAWLEDNAGLVYLPVARPADDADEQLQDGSLPPGHILLFERPTADRNELFVVRVDERGRITPRPEPISAGQLDELIKKQTGKELEAWSFVTKTAFLPDVGTPDVDAVLDLASGEMLPSTEASEFARLGKGDLAYDDSFGGLVTCLRGAEAAIWNGNRFVEFKPVFDLTGRKGCKLPPLPCRLLVKTAEDKVFDVKILSADKSGEGDKEIPRNTPGIRLRYDWADPEIDAETYELRAVVPLEKRSRIQRALAK
jgi:serine/threonine protein kinase